MYKLHPEKMPFLNVHLKRSVLFFSPQHKLNSFPCSFVCSLYLSLGHLFCLSMDFFGSENSQEHNGPSNTWVDE